MSSRPPLLSLSWLSRIAALLLVAAPASGQIIGGEIEQLHSWEGTSADAWFGSAVSGAGDVNGDGFQDVVVGASQDTGSGGLGVVRVYSGMDGTLIREWAGIGRHGVSVAAFGDQNGDGFDDIIVGADYTPFGAELQAGAAMLYSGADGSIIHEWHGEHTWETFGGAVANAGDVNGDGTPDIIIGASGTRAPPPLNSQVGSASVYSGVDGSLIWRWTGAASGELYLGTSVAGAGDLDQDGFDDLLVGNGEENDGKVFAFSGQDGTLLYAIKARQGGSWFGHSVSSLGDITGDGVPDSIVGAPRSRSTSMHSRGGAAFIFSGADGTSLWEVQSGTAWSELGSSVSSAGDFDGDGIPDFIIGARLHPEGSIRVGAAFLYSGSTKELLHSWNGQRADSNFGDTVASAGDLDGDGLDEIMIGAPTDFGNDRGSVEIHGLNSYLNSNTFVVSNSVGANLELELDFPEEDAFYGYKVLMSATGTGPMNYGVNVPLTEDDLVIRTFHERYPLSISVYSDLHGTLDANGDASATATMPAGALAHSVGRVYYIAAIAFQSGPLPEVSSAVRMLTIVP